MDQRPIDHFARLLAGGVDRRRLIGSLAALLAGLSRPPAALAACKKVGRKCDKNQDCCDHADCKGGKCKCRKGYKECQGRCYDLDKDEKHCGTCTTKCAVGETCRDGRCDPAQLPPPPGPCQPDCAGTTCGDDGCGGSCGACGGGETCDGGTCVAVSCPADAAVCPFDGPLTPCPDLGPNCICQPTTEGTVRCADFGDATGSVCGQCQSSADCVALGFGPDAFCAKTTGECCGPDADNVCRRPCPA